MPWNSFGRKQTFDLGKFSNPPCTHQCEITSSHLNLQHPAEIKLQGKRKKRANKAEKKEAVEGDE